MTSSTFFFLHLGWILQLQLGQELPSRHDAAGRQGMAHLARLKRRRRIRCSGSGRVSSGVPMSFQFSNDFQWLSRFCKWLSDDVLWISQQLETYETCLRPQQDRIQIMRKEPSLRRLQGHDHLHGFQFLSRYVYPSGPHYLWGPVPPRHHKGLALGDLGALLVQVPHHLAVDVRAQLRRVVDVGDHDGLSTDDETQAQGLAEICPVNTVSKYLIS